MKIDHGLERLMFLAFFLVFFFHITTCAFVIIAQMVEDSKSVPPKTNWIKKYGYDNLSDAD